MDAVSGLFLDALGTDMGVMESYFPFVTKAYSIFQYTAWAVLFLIFAWQLFRAFGGPITEAENPWHLMIRGGIFAVLIGYAKPIFNICLNIAKAPYTSLMEVSMTSEDFTFAGIEQVLTNGLTTIVASSTVVGLILILILLISLGWNYFKLLLETVERYIVVGVLCYTSPMAFSVGGSKATNNIFKSWCRMVGSQLLLLVMNVWFLRGFASSVGQFIGNGGATPGGQGSIFLWMFCALAYLKCAQRFDSYLASMGLNVAQTGSSMAMEMMMAARVVSGLGGGSRSAGAVFGKSGGSATATGTGAAGSSFAAGLASKFNPNSYVRDAVVEGGERMGFRGGAGAFGRAVGGMAARNGATLSGESISSVAARAPGTSGTIGGDIADRSLGNYMPHMAGMQTKGTQISGGHISTTATTPDGKTAEVDMYSAAQFERPEVPHSVVTASDGSQWYQMASGEGRGAFYDAPTFGGVPADSAVADGVVAEGTDLSGESIMPNGTMDTPVVPTMDSSETPQFTGGSDGSPEQENTVFEGTGGMPPLVGPSIEHSDFSITEEGMEPLKMGMGASSPEITNLDGVNDIPAFTPEFAQNESGVTEGSLPEGGIEMPSFAGTVMDQSGFAASEGTPQFATGLEGESVNAESLDMGGGAEAPTITGNVMDQSAMEYTGEVPQFTGGIVSESLVPETGIHESSSELPSFADNVADHSGMEEGTPIPSGSGGMMPDHNGVTHDISVENPSFAGTVTDHYGIAGTEQVPGYTGGAEGSIPESSIPGGSSEMPGFAAGFTSKEDTASFHGGPAFGGSPVGGSHYGSYNEAPAQEVYSEAPLVAATFPQAQEGTSLRTVGEGVIEASTPDGGNTLWYNSAFYQEPDAPHGTMEAANGVPWFTMQQQADAPHFELGDNAASYNQAAFQNFMPGFDNQVSQVDGTHRQDGHFEVRHTDGSGTVFYDTARYAPPRGDYKVFEDAKGSQWYAIRGEAAVDRKPVFVDGKAVYEGEKLKTVSVETVRYKQTPAKYAEPKKRGDIVRKPPRRKK